MGVSYITWMKSKNSINEVRVKLQAAHSNITTAFSALTFIHQQVILHTLGRRVANACCSQADYKLILDVHSLVLTQVQARDTIEETRAVQELKSEPNDDNTEILVEPDSALVSSQSQVTTPGLSEPLESDISAVGFRKKDHNHFTISNDRTSQLTRRTNLPSFEYKATCYWTCPCQCHVWGSVQSPNWLTGIIGNLFYRYTGTLLLQLRPCSYLGCQQNQNISCQLTYHLPQWLARRSFTFAARFWNLGVSTSLWSIDFPRAISGLNKAWDYI